MKKQDTTSKTIQQENEELRLRLDEAEETLRAIRQGEIDALVVKGQYGHQVYTLKGAEHTYRVLIESMNEGAVTLDDQGTILYSNNSFAQLTEIPLEHVIGSTFQSLLNANERQTFEILLRNTKKEKNSVKEMHVHTKSKKFIPVLLSITPIQFDNGHNGMSVIITNLTEQKRNEELAAAEKFAAQKLVHEKELRSNAEAAAEALKIEKDNLQREIKQRKKLESQKDEFIGMASHELKTPVTSIKAYTQVLQLRFRKENNIKATDLLGKMDAQLDKLTNLISDLLDVTKIAGGKLQFQESYFDLNELVEEITEEVQRTTAKHKIVKELTESKTVWGDRDRIGQVITNFLTNAIKYSPDSDSIIVKTTTDAKKIKLSIQDFGVGIPQDAQNKVFDRFFRVDGLKQETYPGLGLGLYISSEIIKRHHGKIWVESKKEKGSIFCFALPLKGGKKVQQISTLMIEELKYE
jgi:PAS domain S-box-containing protein